jgi:hypothetical protein
MYTYTVTSLGREVGTSSLDFARFSSHIRCGSFNPSVVGCSLMHIITGVRDSFLAMSVAQQRGELDGLSPAQLKRTAHYARVVAAEERVQELCLQLRGPNGHVIPCEDLDIRDTQLFIPEIHGESARPELPLDDMSKSDREIVFEMREFINELEDSAEPWEASDPWTPEPAFGRYQLLVVLANEWDIP